jgi:hypothetical protein
MAIPNRNLDLWMKLVDLPLDHLAGEPAPAFGFIKRLMRDEKWDYATAVRVTAEYRRYLLLAHLGAASPSPMVDAAWHLHLTYTRAYNVGLCERTLARPLDHTPSGNAEESVHYANVHEATRDRYLEVFGEAPPADIWPAPAAAARKRKGSKSGSLAGAAMVLAFAWFAMRPSVIVFLFIALFVITAALMNASAGVELGGDGGDGSGDGGGGDGCGGGCGGGCG